MPVAYSLIRRAHSARRCRAAPIDIIVGERPESEEKQGNVHVTFLLNFFDEVRRNLTGIDWSFSRTAGRLTRVTAWAGATVSDA